MSVLAHVAGRRRGASVIAAAALGAALLAPGAPAALAAPSPAGVNQACADVLPLASVNVGDIGTGWTVVRGQTPQAFEVEILGVYTDGVAPGRDIIMVEVSDLPGQDVVSAGDGIWAGMSGSPVYVDGKLVGAVAYGFSTGPSRIGGLSPASEMAKLLTLPDPATAAAAGVPSARLRLSPALRSALAARTGRSVAATGDFERLPVPFAISGVPARGRKLLGQRLDAAGVAATVTRGSRAAAPAGSFATPIPGGNIAAMIAYGDVTMGGVGTVTWVCGDRALAFGHPLALSGPASFGASDATSLAIVKDPTTGPFKMATIGDPFGIVDQDRLAGIREHLGVLPPSFPVIARVQDLDLGVTRTGTTQVTSADWVGSVAPQHLYSDLLSTTDREGPGTATLRFRVTGTRAGGAPWSLDLSDRVVSSQDIQFEAASRLDSLLYRLTTTAPEAVSIEHVRIDATVQQALAAAQIVRVRVARNGGDFVRPSVLRIRSGDALVVRVGLKDRSGVLRFVDVPLTVPADAIGSGSLVVAGGGSLSSPCDFDPTACGSSFGGLLQRLQRQPRSDDLVVQLLTDGLEGTVTAASVRARQPVVVAGSEQLQVLIR